MQGNNVACDERVFLGEKGTGADRPLVSDLSSVSAGHGADPFIRPQLPYIIRETMMWLREPNHFKQYETWYEKRYGVPLK